MFGLFFQVGFGKGTASKQVWLDGVDPGISESQLERQLSKYGKVGLVMICPMRKYLCI